MTTVRAPASYPTVTVCYEVEVEERPDTGVLAGVDMNVRQVAVVDTTGGAEIIPAPDTGRLDAKIGRNQRRLARQRKGSRRRMRTRLRLQRLQRKRANKRRNWQHQVSRRIANRASTVIVEKLNTSGDDQIGQGHAREPRHEGEGQVRSQPGDPEHRLAWHEGESRLQVHEAESRSTLHTPASRATPAGSLTRKTGTTGSSNAWPAAMPITRT